jgi:nucleotide-binding universal stress UspA family protein
MSTSLCATDFSPCSHTASRLATALARRRAEGLLLLHALEPLPLAVIESKLRAQVPPEAAERGIGTRISVLEGQEAAEAILQAAQCLDVDVSALASHGRTGLGRLLLGSMAEEVARKSSRPSLIVHAKQGGRR